MIRISKLKKEITLYSLIAAVITGVISLLVIGPDIFFPYGLAIGICIAIVNLNIISVSIERAFDRGKRWPVIVGFFIRVLLYGGAFLLAVRTSPISGLGAAIAFLLPHLMMYLCQGILPYFRRKLNKEPPAVYITDTKSNLFIKEPWIVLYKNGRAYVTYKHYRKIRVAGEGDTTD